MMRLLAYAALLLSLALPAAADDFIYHGSFLWNDIRHMSCQDGMLYCAFYDGLGVINLDADFTKKKLYGRLELDGIPRLVHAFGDIAAVETDSGQVYLVDISQPSQPHLLGSFRPPGEIWDMVRLGDYLYTAMEYDGIYRYDIGAPENIVFDDSSMAGIRVIALDTGDSTLYALDNYNGVVLYHPDETGFGPPLSELYLPEPAISMTVAGDTVYAGVQPTGYLVGAVGDAYQPEYVEKRSSYIRADVMAATPRGIVLANSVVGFELIYPHQDSIIDYFYPVGAVQGRADIFAFDGGEFIAYPDDVYGFVSYNVDYPALVDLQIPQFVYASPGPITQVQFARERLHVVGTNNWYEIYDVSDPAAPVRSGKLINPPYRPAGMCTVGDTLFIADYQTKTVFPAYDDGTGDPVVVPPFFALSNSIGRPYFIPGYFGNADLFYSVAGRYVIGTSRNASGSQPGLVDWLFPEELTAALVDDTVFYTGDISGNLWANRITEDLEYETTLTIPIAGRARDFVRVDTMLYVAADGLQTFGVGDPLAPQLIAVAGETGTVSDLFLRENWLLCAAAQGIFIYDISGGLPQLLFSGGHPATSIHIDGDKLAASNGRSVRLYTLPILAADDEPPLPNRAAAPVLVGYPNPFNPHITLAMDNFGGAGQAIVVDVYDVLGRRLRRLDVAAGSGRREVVWDGRDEDGIAVASGIYLFRAVGGEARAVFKGVLLK